MPVRHTALLVTFNFLQTKVICLVVSVQSVPFHVNVVCAILDYDTRRIAKKIVTFRCLDATEIQAEIYCRVVT